MSEKVTLLIVEEDPEQAQSLLAALLRDCPGREIVVARTGLKGLSRLRQEPPDVILLDCTDADSASGTIFRWLQEKNHEVPVVILTGGNSGEVIAEVRRFGGARHVVRQGNYRGAVSAAVREAIARFRAEQRLRKLERAAQGRAEAGRPGGTAGALRHEINNPLTGILGNAELILQAREHLPVDVVHRVETIVELAVRLRKLMRSTEGIRLHVAKRPAASMATVGSAPVAGRQARAEEE